MIGHVFILKFTKNVKIKLNSAHSFVLKIEGWKGIKNKLTQTLKIF